MPAPASKKIAGRVARQAAQGLAESEFQSSVPARRDRKDDCARAQEDCDADQVAAAKLPRAPRATAQLRGEHLRLRSPAGLRQSARIRARENATPLLWRPAAR